MSELVDAPTATLANDTLLAVRDGSNPGLKKTTMAAVTLFVGGGGGGAGLSAIYEDQKAANTAGGTPTAGSWQTRTLNTEVYDDIGITLASNQLALPAGTYDISAWSGFYRCGRVRTRIQDITNAATLALSLNSYAFNNTSDGQVTMQIDGRFVLAGAATIELQYQVEVAQATTGLGNLSNMGIAEVYSRVKITKLA